MERLTEYYAGYAHGKPGRTVEQALKSSELCRGEFEATGVVDRLAEYEDTGLEPDEVEKMKSELEFYKSEQVGVKCFPHATKIYDSWNVRGG